MIVRLHALTMLCPSYSDHDQVVTRWLQVAKERGEGKRFGPEKCMARRRKAGGR